MTKYKFILILISLTVIMNISSCKKYLDEKPDIKLSTPSRLTDLQAILDNLSRTGFVPVSGETSSDNYYIETADYNALDEDQQRIYSWKPDHLFSTPSNDWGLSYRVIYYCNTVLDALPSIKEEPGTANQRADIQGQAFLLRGLEFFSVLSVWSLQYDASTSSGDLGIPLRLNADYNEQSVRASIQSSYEQAIADLKAAVKLLPTIPISPVRGSKTAAYGYLSRLYLSMRDYPAAKLYADSALQLNNKLLDYNSLNPNDPAPVSQMNVETISYLVPNFSQALYYGYGAKIDSVLYNSYVANDLRKTVFFELNPDGSVYFKGNYTHTPDQLFAGLATDELYLTKAECEARSGNITDAMIDLNSLLIRRFVSGTFVPLTAVDGPDALNKILKERRKELLMRCLRWMDLKRLNKEGAGIMLLRKLNGQSISLIPNDLRYALALPEDIIALSGMTQNPR